MRNLIPPNQLLINSNYMRYLVLVLAWLIILFLLLFIKKMVIIAVCQSYSKIKTLGYHLTILFSRLSLKDWRVRIGPSKSRLSTYVISRIFLNLYIDVVTRAYYSFKYSNCDDNIIGLTNKSIFICNYQFRYEFLWQ